MLLSPILYRVAKIRLELPDGLSFIEMGPMVTSEVNQVTLKPQCHDVCRTLTETVFYRGIFMNIFDMFP